MQTFTTQQMKEFVEFWKKAKLEYGFNSTLKFEEVLKEISDLDYWKKNRVVDGIIFSDPTTPSTQASGTVSATWRVCVTKGVVNNDGLSYFSNKDTGVVYTVQSFFKQIAPPVLAIGQSVTAVILGTLWNDNGVIKTAGLLRMYGTPATTGQEQTPTDAEIKAYLISAPISDLPVYVRIAKLTLNRTGDTTVTQSQDNTWRDV